jgi:hypothetical protein
LTHEELVLKPVRQCPECGGSGKCPSCGGCGLVLTHMKNGEEPCPHCTLTRRGSPKPKVGKCRMCEGSGTLDSPEKEERYRSKLKRQGEGN